MADRKIKTFTGKSATVSWDRQLCIHAGECVRAKGDLFSMDRDTWCEPDSSNEEEILEVVTRCPTGALSVKYNDSSHIETAASDNTITVVYSGPLMLKGELEIDDTPADAPGLKYRTALCRCGMSKNKPYCDNSHAKSDFMDYGAVGDTGTALEQTGGPLKVTVMENGPVRLSGNMRIIAGSGRSAWQGTSTALCRCGLSKNKPFCDGAHRKAGWIAD